MITRMAVPSNTICSGATWAPSGFSARSTSIVCEKLPSSTSTATANSCRHSRRVGSGRCPALAVRRKLRTTRNEPTVPGSQTTTQGSTGLTALTAVNRNATSTVTAEARTRRPASR
jgi:hypothetical protein